MDNPETVLQRALTEGKIKMERVRKANGNSFGPDAYSNIATLGSIRRPVPTWKFGVSPGSYNSDRGYM